MKLPVRQSRIHAILTLLWVCLILPTIIWWHSSILWVALMSVYAVISTHWSAWEAAKAKEAAEATEKRTTQRKD